MRFPDVNPYRKRLLMNKRTSQLVEEYSLNFFNQQDYQKFLTEYEARKQEFNASWTSNGTSLKTSPLVYGVRYFHNLTVHELCSSIYSGLLYIDKVDLRLKEVNDIPFEDELYLYKACLSGFKILY
jgi:hypothetical protein